MLPVVVKQKLFITSYYFSLSPNILFYNRKIHIDKYIKMNSINVVGPYVPPDIQLLSVVIDDYIFGLLSQLFFTSFRLLQGFSTEFALTIVRTSKLNSFFLFLPIVFFTLLPDSLFKCILFSREVESDSLWHHRLQHARPPCPSPES